MFLNWKKKTREKRSQIFSDFSSITFSLVFFTLMMNIK